MSAAKTPKMRSCWRKGPNRDSSSFTGQRTFFAARKSISDSFSPGTSVTRNAVRGASRNRPRR